MCSFDSECGRNDADNDGDKDSDSETFDSKFGSDDTAENGDIEREFVNKSDFKLIQPIGIC